MSSFESKTSPEKPSLRNRFLKTLGAAALAAVSLAACARPNYVDPNDRLSASKPTTIKPEVITCEPEKLEDWVPPPLIDVGMSYRVAYFLQVPSVEVFNGKFGSAVCNGKITRLDIESGQLLNVKGIDDTCLAVDLLPGQKSSANTRSRVLAVCLSPELATV